MLDFSFGEILVIAIIAVIFLGPDKLPQTFVKIAKFLRAVKKTINDAKDTLDREIHITEMKQDALEYKRKFENSALNLKDDIIKSANLEPTKTKLQSELEGLKNEIESLKVADKLNEPLDKSSISFDEVESKGKELQNRLKRNLKSTKDLDKKNPNKELNNSSKSSAKKVKNKSSESSVKKGKAVKDSNNSNIKNKTKKATKSTDIESKKTNTKKSKDSKNKATKKCETKSESKPKKSKKSKNTK